MAHTPWGEIRVNDAHVHYFSREFYSELAPGSLASNLHWEIPPADPSILIERWRTELDTHGVSRACLIASLPGHEDTVAQAVAAHPGRFYGYFMFNPLQPRATERMDRAAANPHLHCVCLFPAMHAYSVADPRLTPILERAAAGKLAVFVHCGALSVGIRQKLGLPSRFDLRFSNPLDLHPVALRFPQVPFIVPHFGAGLLREALMLADLCPNVWLDTSSTNRWMKYEGLDLRQVFQRCLDTLGPSRLLFGTDSSFFPCGWNHSIFEQQTTVLHQLGLNATDAQQIFGTNLERLLKP